MLDPDLTGVMKRRIAAFAVDFGLVAVLTALVGWSQVETFSWTETDPTTGDPIWTGAQWSRLTELASGFNRQVTRGQTKYVIDFGGAALTVGVAAVLALLVFVLLPANTGWSPGKKLFSLSVRSKSSGRPARLSDYALRSAVGTLDLLPVIIPGLVGFLVASRTRHHQRLGDLVAGTVVVDARSPERHTSDDAADNTSGNASDDRDERRPRRRRSPEVQDHSEMESMIDLGDRLGTSDAEKSELQVLAAADALVNPTPPAIHDRLVEPGDEDETADEPRGEALEDAAASWEQPVAEPAPVWRPDFADFSDQTPATSTSPSTAFERTAAEPSGGNTTLKTEAKTTAGTAATATAAAVGEPVWNDDWNAWLYWEPATAQWLRHDEQSGSWVPIG